MRWFVWRNCIAITIRLYVCFLGMLSSCVIILDIFNFVKTHILVRRILQCSHMMWRLPWCGNLYGGPPMLQNINMLLQLQTWFVYFCIKILCCGPFPDIISHSFKDAYTGIIQLSELIVWSINICYTSWNKYSIRISLRTYTVLDDVKTKQNSWFWGSAPKRVNQTNHLQLQSRISC